MTQEVSTPRLYGLRAIYLLIAVGLAIVHWPGIVSPPPGISLMGSVVRSVLGAVSLLAILGLRYPVQMIPLLLFELGWKTIWVLRFGPPRWLGGQMDAATSETLFACLMGVVLTPIALPWGYVYDRYLRLNGSHD
jgi:hypothetical protein